MQSSDDMNLAAIEACLGPRMASYAKNKHQGGSNGRKGTRYEDLYLAFKVAEAAALRVAETTREWPHVRGQAIGFVDDVVIADITATAYFQCKNALSVDWTSGDHPIADDFSMQKTLADYLGIVNPSTALVVADEQLKMTLSASRPKAIEPHTYVHYFPYCGGSCNRLVLENADLRSVLSTLARVSDPLLDELVGVFQVLLISCVEHLDGASVGDILTYARTYHPSQLRPFPTEVDWASSFDPRFRDVLAKIQGLRYDAPRGYFQWAAFGTSGILDFDCAHPKFKLFQDEVIDRHPATFEELEILLS